LRQKTNPFNLTDYFLNKYKNKKPPFGYNGLGEFVYMRTYSRIKNDGTKEEWWETVKRVVEGIYNIQKDHIDYGNLGWNAMKAQKSAQEMYDLIFNMQFLPSGRALWALGTNIIDKKRLTEALYNCSFISTENLKDDPSYPFRYAMDMLMCGVGVGFDVRGSESISIKPQSEKTEEFIIPDTREGWVESTGKVILSFFGSPTPILDYSQIRPKGAPIKTFGGISSGSEPLEELHKKIVETLSNRAGSPISQTNIVDIFNLIGKTVIAGNVRRSAEIALGFDNEEFLDLKNYEKNPDRKDFGWASNNSIIAEIGMNYSEVAKRIKDNGDPGIMWLENVRNYGRMKESEKNRKDFRIMGLNPCGEIGLESSELCVTGDTRILTRDGYPKIKDVIGKSVDVWNGDEWSSVIPQKTNDRAKILKISFSDGSMLKCTEYHKFNIAKPSNKNKEIKTCAKDLQPNDILNRLDFDGKTDGIYDDKAFEWGIFAGGGYIDDKHIYAYRKVNLTNTLNNFDLAKDLKDKTKGIPEYFFSLDHNSTLNFIAGWIEAGGSVQKNTDSENYRIYGGHQKMLDLQLLCRKVGINYSSVNMFAEKGTKTNYGIRNYDLYYLTIPTFECKNIPTRIKKVINFGSRYKNNNAYPYGKKIDNSKQQRVIKIEYIGKEPTFCFSEPIKHMAVFNNVLTYQCNLVEVFPFRNEDKDQFLRTLKYAYLFAKSITLLETNWIEANRVMMRNRRLGVSITGVAQFISSKGVSVLKNWLTEGYDTLKNYDEIYSDWFAIPRSIKLTTIKPSGTVSLLGGATPGVHYPESTYYIRRIRLANNSSLVPVLKEAGYKIEPAIGQEKTTVVVEFPVFVGENVRTLEDISMWEQLAQAAFLQKYWADNSVSVTISFDSETEGQYIERALDFYQYQLKAVSFLPKIKDGVYQQMPYEKIDKDTYEKILTKIKPLNFKNMAMPTEALNDKYCNNDLCEI
jgi:ribonucleotide reductase alpha subunit